MSNCVNCTQGSAAVHAQRQSGPPPPPPKDEPPAERLPPPAPAGQGRNVDLTA